MGEPVVITTEALGAVQGDAFRALLPEDIRAKPYVKDVNGFGDLVKKLDGAQTLLGQRAVPEATDPEVKWAEFHGKVRPEKPEGYGIPVIEGVPEEFVKQGAENKLLRGILHAAGASPYQAKIIISGILKSFYTAEQTDKQTRADAFTKLSTELFGDQKDTIITNGKKFLAANLPANVQPLLDGLDEKQLTVVLAAVDGMAKKFTGEDPFRGGGGGGGGGSVTKDQIVAQMQTIMKDPAYSDPFKDRVKHADLNRQMDVLRGKLKTVMGSA